MRVKRQRKVQKVTKKMVQAHQKRWIKCASSSTHEIRQIVSELELCFATFITMLYMTDGLRQGT